MQLEWNAWDTLCKNASLLRALVIANVGILQWLDKETGVGGMLTTQVLPPGDPMVTELLLEMEKCLYKHIRG